MGEPAWHARTAEEVARDLRTELAVGLSTSEVRRRAETAGANRLASRERPPAWRLLLAQFSDFMVLVLLGATVVSALLGEFLDAVTIFVIVLLNGILGFVQEYRAERCLEALRELSAPVARVVRDGSTQTIPAAELVPGDLVLLDAGDRIPADLRLLEAVTLEVDEAALTGESVPVSKRAEVLDDEGLAVADRSNMGYLGALVTRGHGRGVVVAIGQGTQMGQIAHLISETADQTTPLQRRLEELGRWLVFGCGAVCGLVFAVGVAQGRAGREMFLTGVSLAVAAIPEGLPAVVTVALALGVQRMSRRGAIVRRLPAVETLGCTTVICADKTGTLTKNEMTVREVWAGGRSYEVEGAGYEPKGEIRYGGQRLGVSLPPELARVLEIGLLCNTATLESPAGRRGRKGGGEGGWKSSGDPTEAALLVLAGKAGLWRAEYERDYRLLAEVPFSSERRRMTSIFENREGWRVVCTKGAPDVILDLCRGVLWEGAEAPLGLERRRGVLAVAETLAQRGRRVLGLAYRLDHGREPAVGAAEAPERWEEGLVFAGLVGLQDPPRPEVAEALALSRQAGVRTLMITGDHALTAGRIAAELGLCPEGARVATGAELDALDERGLRKLVRHTSVFARVSPRHKLLLVEALQANGEVVAMTGDGVNDAPAIRQADIGIAMGLSGTDVAKEASAMVLADDNYATIVRAVEEGRSIYENVRKFIRYLLTCNVGEVLAMSLAIAFNLPLPLLAIQVLWMNLVTDGIPALALGLDAVSPGAMRRPPRQAGESVFAGGVLGRILSTGSLIGLTTVGVFLLALFLGDPVERARTIAFTTLVLAQLIYVFRCRETPRGLEIQLFGNPWLIAATVLSLGMQVLVLYQPDMSAIFRTTPLKADDWFLVVVAAGYAATLGDLRLSFRRKPVRA